MSNLICMCMLACVCIQGETWIGSLPSRALFSFKSLTLPLYPVPYLSRKSLVFPENGEKTVCVSVCVSVYVSVCVSECVSVYLFVYRSPHQSFPHPLYTSSWMCDPLTLTHVVTLLEHRFFPPHHLAFTQLVISDLLLARFAAVTSYS